MSLTPVEVAMCMDALLSAGVPQRIAYEFIDTRGLRDRIQVIRVDSVIDDQDLALDRSIVGTTLDMMARDLGYHLASKGLAFFANEPTEYLRHLMRLSISVVAPHGWSPMQAEWRTEYMGRKIVGSPPPSKVQR
jgi:hypothetical protein